MLVSKALATKIGAGVAAAGIAVGGGAAVANASSTPNHAHKARLHTSLSIAAGPGHVVKGKYPHTVAWIAGRLTSHRVGLAGQWILLRRDESGRWVTVNEKKTGFRGFVTFKVHGLRHGASFRLVYRGQANFAPSKSDIITIAPVK
jgi:hypothetical protein